MNLAEYGFPSDAKIFVEAYRQTVLMRFDCGNVMAPVTPADTHLSEFDSVENVLFRVKLTAVSEKAGMLLGEAEQIQPREPNEEPQPRVPLLPVVPTDIGQEIWKIDYEGGTRLLINRELRDWKQTVASSEFRALVYPAALRQILERVLLVDKCFDVDDPADWRSKWLRFAARVPGSSAPPQKTVGEESLVDWIDDATAAFARQFALRSLYVTETMKSERT
jgi:hypothetical protein